MIDTARHRRQVGRLLYVLLFLSILVLRLLPLGPGRVQFPGPDLALCLTLAWLLRRRDQVPVLAVAGLFLLEDIVLMRPPGLWAALVVIGTDAARRREYRWRELPFVIEWLRVAMLVAIMMATCRLALALFLLPLPPLGQAILKYIATVAAYPVVAGLLAWPLGLRRTPSEIESR